MKSRFIFFCALLFPIAQQAGAQLPQLWAITRNGANFYNNYAGNGAIFKINGDGTGFDTTHAFNGLLGDSSCGNLIKATDGKLYGLASKGGKGGAGIIFSINPSNNNFTDLYDFDNFHGARPFGSLVQASNGILYGMTYTGGMYTEGVIFSFDLSDNSYTDLHDFNFTDGAEPYFGNMIQISNGLLYGMTYKGGSGAIGYGVIFSFNTSTNTYTKVYDFDGTGGGYPFGSLLQATNGNFYGMCHTTPTGSGAIFCYNPDSNTYRKLHDFSWEPPADPYGSFIQLNDSLLYAMTFNGGKNFVGDIFSFNVNTDSLSDLYDFDDVTGSQPYGSLMQASNGELYGMTSDGGLGLGNVFSFNPDSNTLKDLYDFNDTMGAFPYGTLIEVTTVSGIQQLQVSNNHLMVYPNPTNGLIFINSEKSIEQVRVTNVLGQLMYEVQPNQTHFNFELKNEGLYFISIVSNGQTITTKIIVAK